MTWSKLDSQARAFRIAHGLFAVVELAGLGYVWYCALARRRDRLLGASVIALVLEGVALVVGRGDCPMGPFQRSLGDPVPMFEWLLPPRAAKAAIPILTAVAVAGMVAVAARPPITRGTPPRA
ncbi:MAG: hypothetical protein LH650_02710 [Chloroflexi bacterium]|nr:hypothetical protein [Chloroflexota bacterium]